MGKTLIINKYKAFAAFKSNVGNNNQFIITSLIGIGKVNDSDKGATSPGSWNPKNVEDAKKRAESFVRKAGLAWSIDCFDELLKDFFKSFYSEDDGFQKDDNTNFVTFCSKKTDVKFLGLKQNEKVSYQDAYRSVYYKFSIIHDRLKKEKDLNRMRSLSDHRIGKSGSGIYFPELELVAAIIDLAIQWRNRLVHKGVDNSVAQDTLRILQKYSKKLNSNEYGTLEIDKTIERFKGKKEPTFKELAVMIRSIIDFGYILNAYWIHRVDSGRYIEKLLGDYMNKSYLDSIRAFDEERRKKHIIQKLKSMGENLVYVDKPTKSEEEKALDAFLSKVL